MTTRRPEKKARRVLRKMGIARSRAEQIRGGHEQVGVRVRVEAGLSGARIPMQIDVGFGDAMIVDPLKSMYPTLLDHLPPVILVYPREAVIAEKLEAMMTRGVTNTRMKDFYDVYGIQKTGQRAVGAQTGFACGAVHLEGRGNGAPLLLQVDWHVL